MLSEWWHVIATTLAKSTGILCSRSSRISVRDTKGRGLTFTRGQGLGVSVYVDTDYAETSNGRRSVSGAAVMCGGVCVFWKSTTQRCVTSSTTKKAECVASGDGLKEALFVCAVLEFLQPHLRGKPVVVFEDNNGLKLWPKTSLARPAVSTLACVITLSGVCYGAVKSK